MAAVTCNDPVEEDGLEGAEMKPINLESSTGQSEEQKPTDEVTQSTEQQLGDGKTKPTSEKIWGSFLKNSGKLGKVMVGKKKKDIGNTEANVEGPEQEKSTALCPVKEGEEGSLPPSSSAEGSGPQKQCNNKEPEKQEDEATAKEQKPSSSNKDVKPKQGEKSSVRDFIRKPVSRIFSHKSTEKKDLANEAQTEKKTRSRSLDRMEDTEACCSATDPTDDSKAAGEAHGLIPHERKAWHSFKKFMPQKNVKKSNEDSKDLEGAEASHGDAGESESKVDHTGQKKWKLKRSWTFQGLKRDPSMTGIHKSKGADKGEQITGDVDQGTVALCEDGKLPGEAEAEDKAHAEQEEEVSTTQRAKSTDHHASEIWTSFKKRVTPKSKKSVDHVTVTEEDQTDADEHNEAQACQEEVKVSKQTEKKTHFNRAVSLKNFLLRKGKSASMDIGEAVVEQKDGNGESAGDAPDDKDGKVRECESQNLENVKHDEDSANQMTVSDLPTGNEEESEVKANKSTNEEEKHSDLEPKPPENPPQAAATSQDSSSVNGTASKEVCQENESSPEDNSSIPEVECAQSSAEGKEESIQDTTGHKTVSLENAEEEINKVETCHQESEVQDENDCSSRPKDDENLNQEQPSDSKHSSDSPAP
uniref:Si:ch211-137a8.4 n=1 Tax=Paramormyrops kingsleyae TaxID=1676925 RepID=A0A3B3RU14_9TELE|nr:uncharacterized protein LOC111844036 [Paramormyrops kingsleyae]XP_023667885.1 uncharacterized protein LOC111844036 [Paramormyrops kingsleyae]